MSPTVKQKRIGTLIKIDALLARPKESKCGLNAYPVDNIDTIRNLIATVLSYDGITGLLAEEPLNKE